ncbi:type II toxin-antitoxin system RelE/ParE family toxin [Billgrantia sp. C5P2]|uniref:type II toxin-antitoxin system RelE/ParE family toxin n=1 Tax=Billgrantia sp. C5P2 TaxID=3436239 RepID=UPI003DA3DE5E
MKSISQTETYSAWFTKLRDQRARAKILARIRRIELGNFGDCEPVGEGVSELRIHYGPGYRVYFVQRGFELVILLAGGDKGSQARDIEIAKQLARELKEVP